MPTPERSVLHVLPHPGGGGETYVDFLSEMSGYRSTRVYLAPSPTPTPSQLARGVAGAFRPGHTYDLLHAHGEAASGLCLPLLAIRPSVVTFNGLHLVRRLSGPRRRAAELNLRAIALAADRLICVARAERDYLADIVPAGRRAAVIHNSVRCPTPLSEEERARIREQLGLEASEPVGIWVGSLDERKDPLVAIRAAETASVSLIVVGDGPLRSQVDGRASELVRILGPRDDVPSLLGAADFYVQTSNREGLAFALLEAMAHGLPAVVNDLPENMEAVGDAGIVVASRDEEALVRAFRRVAGSEAERTALGDRARQRVARLFDSEDMLARTRAVYDDVLA